LSTHVDRADQAGDPRRSAAPAEQTCSVGS